MQQPTSVYDALSQLGYTSISDNGEFYRTQSIYRGGDGLSLSIHKESGRFYDFVTHQSGTLKDLSRLTLGKEINFKIQPQKRGLDKPKRKFDFAFCENLKEDFTYFNQRGISSKTLKYFRSGIVQEGDLYKRHAFPYFENGKAVAVSARDTTGKSKMKWVNWNCQNVVYPLYLNKEDILKSRRVILVEGLMDGLALHEAGIKDFVVCFGTKMSSSVYKFLNSLNPARVIIAFDTDENGAGQRGAAKVKEILDVFFDDNVVSIFSPPMGQDLAEMNNLDELKL